MRIVITAMGAVTPIGFNVKEYWENLINGQCGINRITRFDPSNLPVKIAAEIKNFDSKTTLPHQILKSSSLFMRYACQAAEEAIFDANFDDNYDKSKIGIIMGTAMSGVSQITDTALNYPKSTTGKVSPHFVPSVLGNMAVAHISIKHNLKGIGFTINTACSSGTDSIMLASMLIKSGQANAILVMGGESIISPTVISSLAQAKALSRNNDDPKNASCPFDASRDGFVIGEGGGAILLESEEHANNRNAKIYAELKGCANCLDAYHITAPDPEGKGAANCMNLALKDAKLKPSDIGYINAHGTSTILGDKAETIAIKSVFKNNPPLCSSTKGATGHLMGAGGLTEIIACVKALNTQIIPPTLHLRNSDPECDLDYVANTARKADIWAAMSNSLGFGGQNSSIVITRYKV